MALDIPTGVAQKLNPIAKAALSVMSPEEQKTLQERYQKRAKSTGLMVFLSIVFPPVQLFLLRKTGLAIAFVLTAGMGGIWYIIEWFLTPKRVREYNANVVLLLVFYDQPELLDQLILEEEVKQGIKYWKREMSQ